MTDPYALFEEARKQSPNPFTLKTVISDQEVWGEVMTDLSSLNQHIDIKIDEAISEIRNAYSRKIGIAIKGDKGTGKSHVIHRIWKKIELEGGAVFAYIPPCSNPRSIDSHVRFYLSESFNHQDVHGATQWQKLATAAIATLKGTEFEEKYQDYLEKCKHPDELKNYIRQTIEKSNYLDFFSDLAESILENRPELDFQFVKAVLFLIFKSDRRAQAALSWIKGEDSPDINELVRLPEYSAEQQEEKSVWMMEQICKLAEIALLPVLICFDQLDSAKPDIESGDSPAQTVARCIDRIYFKCSNVILLCCLIEDTWREIKDMGSGIPDRVDQWSVTANPPDFEQMKVLVQQRLDWFYQHKNLNSQDYPFLYPFKESQIRKIASERAGVRSLLEECAKKFDYPVDDRENRKKEFQSIYNELLQKIDIPMDDDDKLAAIIVCNMKMIPGGGTASVSSIQVETIDVASHDLHFTVCGYDFAHREKVKIGVRICETTNGQTFNAVMKRLLDDTKHNITRGCLVRSTDVPRNWKKGKELKEQLKNQRGKVVKLNQDDIKPLAVLKIFYEEAEKHGFEKEEVINFVQELGWAAENQLICEIIRAPL